MQYTPGDTEHVESWQGCERRTPGDTEHVESWQDCEHCTPGDTEHVESWQGCEHRTPGDMRMWRAGRTVSIAASSPLQVTWSIILQSGDMSKQPLLPGV